MNQYLQNRLYPTRLVVVFILLLTAMRVFATEEQLLERQISIAVNNETIDKVLMKIEKVANVKFMYSTNEVDIRERISINVKNERLRKVLERLLSPRKITYKVHEQLNTITLKRESIQDLEVEGKVELEINPTNRWELIGTVTDAGTKLSLPGVNVLVKGTTNGTTTDANGSFSISAEKNDILTFSFIGFKPVEVLISDQVNLQIEMSEDITGLKEVIINAGYWKIKEKEQTGNIARIDADEIALQPSNNVLQSMQGKMAGVFITQQSGVPGGSFNIQIRGQNSLRNSVANNGNRPLYIIDGVPFASTPLGTPESGAIIDGGNPLSTINPADIESIEILKDADATAIYGSRGANGVVLVTTRKGKVGKTQFNANLYQGTGTVNSKMDLLNTQQYLTMRNEAFTNDQVTPGTYYTDYDVLSWDQTSFTDWQEKLIGGTSHITNAQMSASGGSASTQFLLGAGYFRETTVFPGDFSNQKISANVKLNHSSNDNRFNLGFSSYYLIDNNALPRVDLTLKALTLAPNAPELYQPDGTLNWENSSWTNPLAYLKQELDARTTNLVSNVNVGYRIAKGLEAKMNLGYTEIRYNEFTSQPRASFDPAFGIPSAATFAAKHSSTWIVEPQLEYKIELGKGTLVALAGSTWQGSGLEEDAVSATGFASDELLRNRQAASAITILSVNDAQYHYLAMFSRLNYNWKGKYIINLTGRRDGSSRFGPGNQFGNFGAIGAAWIFTEEEFLKSNVVSFGKLRVSYGSTGSDQIGDYGFRDLWTTTPYPYDGRIGLNPSNLSNPNYGWEVNKKWESGLDLGFAQEKVNLSVSYYHNQSSNQLVGVPLSAVTGFSSVQANFPAVVVNSGLELVLTSTNMSRKNFTWTTSANVTFPHNELKSFPDLKNSSFAFDYIEGKPLSVSPSFHYLGVDPQTGLYQHQDVDEDQQFTALDLRGVKSLQQDYYGGFQNTFTWNGLSADVFIQFVKQVGRNYLNYFSSRPGLDSNQPAWVLDRWQNPGDEKSIQQFTQGFGDPWVANQVDALSDNRFSDASFIRLRSVSLSYTMPSSWISKAGFQMMKVSLQGQNLWTLTNYQGLDSETQSGSLPPLKRWTMGLNITF